MSSLRRVDDLTLTQIDRLIAKVEGIYYARSHGDFKVHISEKKQVYLITSSGRNILFAPTVDWRQGGPLLDRNDISIEKIANGWRAHLERTSVATGPTVLVAAMRTRIKMTYGEELALEVDEL
jgi:hypothetical protein